jgi:hypothetical protein
VVVVTVSFAVQEKVVKPASATASVASVAFAGAVIVEGSARNRWPCVRIAEASCYAEDIEGTGGGHGRAFGLGAAVGVVVGVAGSATAAETLG